MPHTSRLRIYVLTMCSSYFFFWYKMDKKDKLNIFVLFLPVYWWKVHTIWVIFEANNESSCNDIERIFIVSESLALAE